MKQKRKKNALLQELLLFAWTEPMSLHFLSFLCDKFDARQLEKFHDSVDFSFSRSRIYYSTHVWFVSFMQSQQTTWRLGHYSDCKAHDDDLNARQAAYFLPMGHRHELYVYQYSPSIDYFDSCCPINGGSRLKRRKCSTRCVWFFYALCWFLSLKWMEL